MVEPIVVVLVAIPLLLALVALVLYNKLVVLRNRIAESWSNVDTELKRRHDLVPNLVETVKGAATHERTLLEDLTRMRADAERARGQDAQQAAENALAQGMARVLAVAEAYPQVRASANFLELQRQLAETEDRIQAARRFYNANVRDHNNQVETIPSAWVAQAGGFRTHAFLQLDDPRERATPQVRL